MSAHYVAIAVANPRLRGSCASVDSALVSLKHISARLRFFRFNCASGELDYI